MTSIGSTLTATSTSNDTFVCRKCTLINDINERCCTACRCFNPKYDPFRASRRASKQKPASRLLSPSFLKQKPRVSTQRHNTAMDVDADLTECADAAVHVDVDEVDVEGEGGVVGGSEAKGEDDIVVLEDEAETVEPSPRQPRTPQATIRPLFRLRGAPHNPLAERMRPVTADEFYGQNHLTGTNGYLASIISQLRKNAPKDGEQQERKTVFNKQSDAKSGFFSPSSNRDGKARGSAFSFQNYLPYIPSMVFFGPPGCGKTTYAKLIGRAASPWYTFEQMSTVSASVSSVREMVQKAASRRKMTGRRTLCFMDEVHRFNKAQQDVFLPYVEIGTLTLIGATTLNPSFHLTPALLSRCKVIPFHGVPAGEVRIALSNAIAGIAWEWSRDLFGFLKSAAPHWTQKLALRPHPHIAESPRCVYRDDTNGIVVYEYPCPEQMVQLPASRIFAQFPCVCGANISRGADQDQDSKITNHGTASQSSSQCAESCVGDVRALHELCHRESSSVCPCVRQAVLSYLGHSASIRICHARFPSHPTGLKEGESPSNCAVSSSDASTKHAETRTDTDSKSHTDATLGFLKRDKPPERVSLVMNECFAPAEIVSVNAEGDVRSAFNALEYGIAHAFARFRWLMLGDGGVGGVLEGLVKRLWRPNGAVNDSEEKGTFAYSRFDTQTGPSNTRMVAYMRFLPLDFGGDSTNDTAAATPSASQTTGDDHATMNAARRTHSVYDRKGEAHFNFISALHKSIRGSDPNATLYYLTHMLKGGENQLYIARRLIRVAVEDIGLANPHALVQANSCYQSVHVVGPPESDLVLVQTAVYLALSPKNVRLYQAYGACSGFISEGEQAMMTQYVEEKLQKAAKDHSAGAKSGGQSTSSINQQALVVGSNVSCVPPLHICNAPTGAMKGMGYGKGYIYPPSDPQGALKQRYMPAHLVDATSGKSMNFFHMVKPESKAVFAETAPLDMFTAVVDRFRSTPAVSVPALKQVMPNLIRKPAHIGQLRPRVQLHSSTPQHTDPVDPPVVPPVPPVPPKPSAPVTNRYDAGIFVPQSSSESESESSDTDSGDESKGSDSDSDENRLNGGGGDSDSESEESDSASEVSGREVQAPANSHLSPESPHEKPSAAYKHSDGGGGLLSILHGSQIETKGHAITPTPARAPCGSPVFGAALSKDSSKTDASPGRNGTENDENSVSVGTKRPRRGRQGAVNSSNKRVATGTRRSARIRGKRKA